ncbi:MAG: helix-turn-helix domain-containing protein [Phycisphaerales bacterium]
METNQFPQLLTIQEAAKCLAVSDRTLFSLTQSGRIKAVRISSRAVRYDMRDLEQFIETMKTGAQ